MTKHDPLGLTPYVKQEEERRKLLESVEKDAMALSSTNDDAKKTAMSVEEQKREKDEARKREIIAVEKDVSPDILKVARTIDQIVNNEVFSTNVELSCYDRNCYRHYGYNDKVHYGAKVTLKDGLIEVVINHNRQDPEMRYAHRYDEEATISIDTENDKIKLFYSVRNHNGKGLYRISRWTRKSPRAFRFMAEDAMKAENEDKKADNKLYINDFIDMYKAVPEILGKAIAKMKEEQEAKKKQLEREAARLEGRTDIVEQIKAYEQDRTSQAEEPRVMDTKPVYGIRTRDGRIKPVEPELGDMIDYMRKKQLSASQEYQKMLKKGRKR